MKKLSFAAALGVALVGGLALAAVSPAKLVYTGEFRSAGPDTSVKITAKGGGGEPTAIKRLDYAGLPAQCDVTGKTTLESHPTFTGVKVNDERKFKIVATSDDGDSSIRFSGKFSRNFNKVRGKLQETITFGPDSPPAETCVGETRRYAAKR